MPPIIEESMATMADKLAQFVAVQIAQLDKILASQAIFQSNLTIIANLVSIQCKQMSTLVSNITQIGPPNQTPLLPSPLQLATPYTATANLVASLTNVDIKIAKPQPQSTPSPSPPQNNYDTLALLPAPLKPPMKLAAPPPKPPTALPLWSLEKFYSLRPGHDSPTWVGFLLPHSTNSKDSEPKPPPQPPDTNSDLEDKVVFEGRRIDTYPRLQFLNWKYKKSCLKYNTFMHEK